jgi:hypothetical protein
MSSHGLFEGKGNYTSQKALISDDPQTEEYAKALFYAPVLFLKKWP